MTDIISKIKLPDGRLLDIKDTWRGIQDNLTSSSNTTESLSAKQGYLLANGSARDNTKVPTSMLQVTTNTSVGLEPTTNTFGYVNGLTKANWNYQQADGILYTQFYNASWKHQIFGDYRTGQISIRGKNNGTWQNWRRVLDETNARTLLGVTDNSSNADVTSSDTNLITARTLYYQLAKKGYTTNTGTVTSVAASGSGGITISGSPITTSGTIAIGLNLSTAINGLGEGSSQATGEDYLVAQYAGGGTTTTTYHRRKVSNVVNATVVKAALSTNATHSNQFLRKDGTWQTPPYPVTSVAGNTGAITADTLRTSLGLSNAMHFLGVTTTNISTGTANTTATVTIGSSNVTAAAGDVVLYGSQEYVWGNSKWNLLGDESSYKVKQTAKSDPTASTSTSTTFIDTISQDANGVITATKKTLPSYVPTSAGVTAVTWDTTNKKLTRTINGTAADVVTIATIKTALGLAKADVGLGSVDNTADANKTVKYANMLTGLSSRSTTMAWGNQTGTVITCMSSSGGGGWGFRDNNPASGQMSMTIDGTVYIKEGAVNVGDAVKSFSVSGKTVTYTTLWGNTGTFTTQDTDTDTKNTAGSTNSTSKLFLIGATSQAANPTTNSYSYTYTNNGLLSALKVGLNLNGTEKAHLEWNDTDQSIDFIFN